MFVRLPVRLVTNTGVEGVDGHSFADTAVVNTDNITYFFADDDNSTNLFFTGEGSLLVLLPIEEVESLFDRYEISIYDN